MKLARGVEVTEEDNSSAIPAMFNAKKKTFFLLARLEKKKKKKCSGL